MDTFPDFPFEDGDLPNQLEMYSNIRSTCMATILLLGEEEVDPIRLKALGDSLEERMTDIPVFRDTELPLAWISSLQNAARQTLEHIRTAQHALLDQ